MNSRGQLLLFSESLTPRFLFFLLCWIHVLPSLNVNTLYNGVRGFGADLFPRSTATTAERWLSCHNAGGTCEKYDFAKREESPKPKKFKKSYARPEDSRYPQ